MNYEQKYKEAMSFLRDLRPHMSDYCKEKLEGFFHELRESKDERIRKGLIEHLKELKEQSVEGSYLKCPEHYDAWIAWLEKQSEQNPAMIQWKGNNLKEVINFTGLYKDGFEKWFHNSWEEFEKYVHEHNNIFKIFNKDGSHIEVPVGAWIVKTPDGYNTASRYVFRQKPIEQDIEVRDLWVYIREWNDKFGRLPKDEDELVACIDYVMKRQKPADKVEPRFKVGDWIVYEGLGTYNVVEIHEGWYSVIDSNDRRWSIMFESESLCHIWTINDAKDGDVLAEHETIVLFKKIEGQNIRCYCTYHYLGFNPTFYAGILQNKNSYYPATKEQRELLFQKMHEAGYEWDAEKKELKKIEQEEDADLTDFESALFSAFSDAWQDYLRGKEVDVVKWTKEHSAELLEVAREQNSAWSEEDEKMWLQIINEIEAIKSNSSTIFERNIAQDKIDWLKSLKPHWKPTKRQLEALMWCIVHLGGVDHQTLGELYEQLYKL